jgi:hypothetical protein
MTGMDDLVTWLRAQLDDDERRYVGSGTLGWLTYRRQDGSIAYTIPAALAEDGETWIAVGAVARDYASAVVVHRETEALAEVNAKRRILDRYADALARQGDWEESQIAAHVCAEEYEGWIIPALALPYVDRPGYREEWR